LATNLLKQGKNNEALSLLQQALGEERSFDRLAQAETLANIILAKEQQHGFFSRMDKSEEVASRQLREQLFALLPAHLRYHNLALPVTVSILTNSPGEKRLLGKLADMLTGVRFERVEPSAEYQPAYGIVVSAAPDSTKSGSILVSLQLIDKRTSTQKLNYSGQVSTDGKGKAELINNFIAKAFSHQVDPPGEPLPAIPILEGLLKQ
jgi:hypothetical protein